MGLIVLLMGLTTVAESYPELLNLSSMEEYLQVVQERMVAGDVSESTAALNVLMDMGGIYNCVLAWAIEDKYLLQEYCMQFGDFAYVDNVILFGLPDSSDIAEEEAIAIAIKEVLETYEEPQGAVDAAVIARHFYESSKTPLYDKANNTVWAILLFSEAFEKSMSYEVFIDAKSGDMLTTKHANDSMPANG